MNTHSASNIFKRETGAYFNSAIAYIFIIVFVLISSGLYMTQFFLIASADMRPFFTLLPFLLAVFMPAVSMRLWAEEKRGNTLELLLTFPMATQEIVAGKFFASLSFYFAALLGTLPIPVMLKALGNPDIGAIAGGYAGAVFIGAFFLSIGIFISGFCRDQIVAFILAMVVCFGLHLIGMEFFAASIDGWVPGLGSFLREFIGTAGHFDSFAKGVIDSRDVLYFVIGTFLFLLLNGFWMEGRMKPGSRKLFLAAAVLSLGVFLAGNWFLSGISLGRFDLTEGKIYTTSEATKKIFRGLKVPVTAKLYISPADKMPTGMKTLEQDILDKFEELRVASRGNFQFKVFHMEAANTAQAQAGGEKEETLEQQLQKKGIQPFQVRAIETDEVAVKLVYAAVTLAYKEKPEEIIPRVAPDTLDELEYRVASKVYRMTLEQTPLIAMVAPYMEKQVEPELAQVLEQMGGKVPSGYRDDFYDVAQMALEYEGYQVFRVKLTKEEPVPANVKTLLVLEPSRLNDRQRYEINRFLYSGGSVFMAVQDYFYNYATSGDNLSITIDKKNPDVNPLLSAWGFEVDDNILVDEQHDVIQVTGGARMGPFEISIPVKVPIQVLVSTDGMNREVSITSRLSSVFYLWGTALKIIDQTVKEQHLEVKTLLTSSKNSWTVPAREGALFPEHLSKTPDSRIGPFPLAVMAQGQFKDGFHGKQAPEWPEEAAAAGSDAKKEPSVLQQASPGPGKLILIGAASLFQKHLIRGGGHLNLFINCVDALTLGDDLITIRSKQPIDRSIGRISSAAKIGWRVFVGFLVPVLLAALGVFKLLMRSRAKQNYLRDITPV